MPYPGAHSARVLLMAVVLVAVPNVPAPNMVATVGFVIAARRHFNAEFKRRGGISTRFRSLLKDG